MRTVHILQINYLYISLLKPNFEFSFFFGFFRFFLLFLECPAFKWICVTRVLNYKIKRVNKVTKYYTCIKTLSFQTMHVF